MGAMLLKMLVSLLFQKNALKNKIIHVDWYMHTIAMECTFISLKAWVIFGVFGWFFRYT